MCFFNIGFYRAKITQGLNAGRITDVVDGGMLDMLFKSSCCGNLCNRYLEKRPQSECAPPSGGTRCEYILVI